MKRSAARSRLMLVFIPLLACGCPPAFERGTSDSGPIDLSTVECAPGTGGLWQHDRWSRMVISARSGGGIFRGEVEVQGRDPSGTRTPERFHKRFEVATDRQAIEIPVLPRNWFGAVVTFRGDGIAPQVWDLKLEGPRAAKYRMLFIGEKSSAPLGLPRAAEKWLALEGEEAALDSVHPQELPRHFLGYQAADLVILHWTAYPDMDADRWEALLEWTRRGGTVAALKGLDRAAVMPAKVREVLDAPPPPRREGLEEGYFVERRVGSGTIFIIASGDDLKALEVFPDGSALPATLAEAMRQAIGRGASPRVIPSTGPSDIESAALEALMWFSGLKYPTRAKVAVFYLGYLGLGFFLAGAFFRWRRRLELMYLAALALAVVAGIGIYRYGLLSAIRETSADEVTVAMVRPGSTIADAVSWIGIGSPGGRDLNIDAAGFSGAAIPSQPAVDDGVRINRLSGMYMLRPEEALPLHYECSGSGLGLRDVHVHANSTRYLRYDYPAELGGTLSARIIEGPDGTLRLQVANSTSRSFRTMFIPRMGVDRGFPLGSLGAGESKGYLLGPSQEVMSGRPPRLFNGPGDELGAITARLLQAVNSRLPIEVDANPQARFPLLLQHSRILAVTDEPIFPSEVLGPIRHSFNILEVDVEEEHGE